MPPLSDLNILTTSHVWDATPWDYSSLRFLQFRADGTAEFTYGYGQTIYAKLPCRFELLPSSVLRLLYSDPPATQTFGRIALTNQTRQKEISYKLVEEDFSGVTSVVARPFRYRWKLDLSDSPFPSGLQFPYDNPTTYYGHRVREEPSPIEIAALRAREEFNRQREGRASGD
jgi:hypothetical protein